jgi:membrane protease YdiL (CAAX protease family)
MQAGGASGATMRANPRPIFPVVAIAVVVVVQTIATWLAFQPARAGTLGFWGLAGGPTLALAVLALVWARREGSLAEWMRPRPGDLTTGVMSGGALFGAAYAFTRFVAPPASGAWFLFVYSQLGEREDLQAHRVPFLCALVLVAAAEEIVWRGLVQDLFAEVVGSRFAWILQGLAYALSLAPTLFTLRPPHGPLNPLLPLAALGAGLLFGFLVRKLGRLPPAIVAHLLFDWLVVVMFRLWGASL